MLFKRRENEENKYIEIKSERPAEANILLTGLLLDKSTRPLESPSLGFYNYFPLRAFNFLT